VCPSKIQDMMNVLSQGFKDTEKKFIDALKATTRECFVDKARQCLSPPLPMPLLGYFMKSSSWMLFRKFLILDP
jgi:hypothetical protein